MAQICHYLYVSQCYFTTLTNNPILGQLNKSSEYFKITYKGPTQDNAQVGWGWRWEDVEVLQKNVEIRDFGSLCRIYVGNGINFNWGRTMVCSALVYARDIF